MKPKHFFVNTDSHPIMVFLVGSWYHKTGILNDLVNVATKLTEAQLAENYSAYALGSLLYKESKSEISFKEYLEKSEIGSFLSTIPELDWDVRTSAVNRIILDFGNYLKKSEWFSSKKKELDKEKKSIKMIRRIMNS